MGFEEMKPNNNETLEGDYPSLNEAMNLELSLSDEEFEIAIHDSENDRFIGQEVSRDTILRIIRKTEEIKKIGPNIFGAMLRILERESMAGYPDKELLKKAIDELAKKYNYKIRTMEDVEKEE